MLLLRFDRKVNAKVLLEDFIVEEWETIDGKGFASKSSKGDVIQVFPDNFQIKLFGAKDSQLRKLQASIEAKLIGSDERIVNFTPLIDASHCNTKRPYIQKTFDQINTCYSNQAYDGAAVMLRKLIESLLIECFEAKGKTADITDRTGNYLMLDGIIRAAMVEHASPTGAWRFGRKTVDGLPSIKDLGDSSAHNRHHSASKRDLDTLSLRISQTVSDLIAIAGIGK